MRAYRYGGAAAIIIFGLAVSAAVAPPAQAVENVFESSRVCQECHEDIYRNWSKSLHALSYSNPIFTAAYRKAYTETKGSAKKYCLNCHAPTVRVTGDYDAELPITKEGITCDFCHTVSRIDLANHENPFTSEPGDLKRSVLKNATSPHHETAYSADFASAKLCAGCHDFVNRHGIRVGDTYSEWLQSPYAGEGKQCQHCHMEEVPGKTANEGGRNKIHDHSLSHNLMAMREAVTLKMRKPVRSDHRVGVEIEISNDRAGHSIPTGTPERHLVLEVKAFDRMGGVVEVQKKNYHKTIVNAAGVEIFSDGDVFLYGTKIVDDNRLKSKETRREKFIFSKRVKDIVNITADVYFLYEPMITQKTTMRIPFYSVNSLVK